MPTWAWIIVAIIATVALAPAIATLGMVVAYAILAGAMLVCVGIVACFVCVVDWWERRGLR